MHVVIAVAVIVLAVIFIAKFGFGTDLLSPSSGEMAIVKRPVVTAVPTIAQKDIAVRPELSLRPETLVPCDAPKRTCGDSCVDIYTDPNNCGACGRACSEVYKNRRNVAEFSCTDARCTIKSCKAGYGFCDESPRLDINVWGCDYNFSSGVTDNYLGDYVYDYSTTGSRIYPLDARCCGGCGKTCPSPGAQHLAFCDKGACKDVCWGAWLNCDNNWSNGCEKGWDNNNCGACGAKCPTNALCNLNTGCCVLKSDQSTTTPDSTGNTCSGHAWNRLLSK